MTTYVHYSVWKGGGLFVKFSDQGGGGMQPPQPSPRSANASLRPSFDFYVVYLDLSQCLSEKSDL